MTYLFKTQHLADHVLPLGAWLEKKLVAWSPWRLRDQLDTSRSENARIASDAAIARARDAERMFSYEEQVCCLEKQLRRAFSKKPTFPIPSVSATVSSESSGMNQFVLMRLDFPSLNFNVVSSHYDLPFYREHAIEELKRSVAEMVERTMNAELDKHFPIDDDLKRSFPDENSFERRQYRRY